MSHPLFGLIIKFLHHWAVRNFKAQGWYRVHFLWNFSAPMHCFRDISKNVFLIQQIFTCKQYGAHRPNSQQPNSSDDLSIDKNWPWGRLTKIYLENDHYNGHFHGKCVCSEWVFVLRTNDMHGTNKLTLVCLKNLC